MISKPRRSYVVIEIAYPCIVQGVEILVQHPYIYSLN